MINVENVKILVVGDIMLDRYIVGNVSRISPEAPVPIVNVIDDYFTLGGCGNVVRNLRELGAQVDCLSFIGMDRASSLIFSELERIGVNPELLICDSEYTTVSKTRIIADERKVQMLRYDRETIKEIDSNIAINHLGKNGRLEYDAIIISDYAKGMITNGLMDYIKKSFDAIKIVDPKPEHGYMYDGVFMLTPNEKEWASLKVSSRYRLQGIPYVLETRGKYGMVLHNLLGGKSVEIPSTPVEVFNVSGAGDTVVAIMALCMSAEIPVIESAEIANKCAAYVVTQVGTSVVPKNKFTQVVQSIL